MSSKTLKKITPKLCPIPNIEADYFYRFPPILRKLAVFIYNSVPEIDKSSKKINIAHYCRKMNVSYDSVTETMRRQRKIGNDFRELLKKIYVDNIGEYVPAILEASMKLAVQGTREGFADRQMLLKITDVLKPDNAPTVNIENMMITRYASISTQKPLEPEDVTQTMPRITAKVKDEDGGARKDH